MYVHLCVLCRKKYKVRSKCCKQDTIKVEICKYCGEGCVFHPNHIFLKDHEKKCPKRETP